MLWNECVIDETDRGTTSLSTDHHEKQITFQVT